MLVEVVTKIHGPLVKPSLPSRKFTAPELGCNSSALIWFASATERYCVSVTGRPAPWRVWIPSPGNPRGSRCTDVCADLLSLHLPRRAVAVLIQNNASTGPKERCNLSNNGVLG
jgi:hypothetical protein